MCSAMNLQNIDPITAKQLIDKKEAILIDVRQPHEHAMQKITGSILIPLDRLSCDILPDTDKKILLHCQKGMRSLKACNKILLENDKITVYNIEGGIEAWQAMGLPTE